MRPVVNCISSQLRRISRPVQKPKVKLFIKILCNHALDVFNYSGRDFYRQV